MSKPAKIVSATIVLFFVNALHAAPIETIPDDTSPPEATQNQPLDENMIIVPAPPLSGRPIPPASHYYPYRQQLTFRAGEISSPDKRMWKDVVLGFQYLFPKFLSPKLEAGADLIPEGKGHLHAGVRWIYFERDYLRPSLKLSLDHRVDSDKQLATFSDIDNYYIRATATLEYVFWNPLGVRLEPELLLSPKESQWMMTLGLSRGW